MESILGVLRRAAFLVCLLIAACQAQAETVRVGQIKECLGHNWTNELVFFPLPGAAVEPGQEARYSLTDDKGQALPFQFWRRVTPDGKREVCVALLVDLPAYTQRSFTLRSEAPGGGRPRGDVKVRAEGNHFIMEAGQTAVQVARADGFKAGTPFEALPAPIQAVKGVSGRWLGEGKLLGKLPVEEFTTEVEAQGPIFAQASVLYRFGPRKHYQVRVRVISGEDVVLVEEDFALAEDELKTVSFVTPPDLAPEIGRTSQLSDWLVSRGMGWTSVVTDVQRYPCFRFNFFKSWEAERVTKYDLSGGREVKREDLAKAGEDWRSGLALTPYQARGYRVTALGFDAPQQPKDYLAIFTRYLSRWQHVNENHVPLPWLADGVAGHFIAFEGHREWGIMVGAPGDSNKDTAGEHGTARFGAIRKVQSKHGETPLDKVKDWVLEWNVPAEAGYPRLYYTPESVARMKHDFPNLPEDIKALIGKDNAALALLTSNDARLKEALREVDALRESADAFLNGGHNTTDTYTHRFQEIVRYAVPVVDIALASKSITPEERARALAVVAFLAYKISDPDYWAYRAYGGGPSNPNMMSIATNALAMCAAMMPGHPKREEWLRLCQRLVCADILMSVSPDGAWLESPGYQGAGNTPINMTVLILKNAGVADLTKDPVFGKRLISVSGYCANLLTPPDPRFAGKRMPMALGDSVPFFNNMFTYLACSAKDAFPEEAGNAIWAWQQMGRPASETLLLLNEHVMDGTIKPVPIRGASRTFSGFGVMLRHGFGTDRETFMTYRQNDFAYGHYDYDQGSFSLFAKGAPLCLDWIDYSPGEAEHHNRVDYHPDIMAWLVPEPDAIVLKPEADYVRSHEAGLPKDAKDMSVPRDAKADWQRQVILVKDTQEPGDATYLVFRDVVRTDRPSDWNVWTMAKKGSERIDGNVARLEGQYGVDVSLFFYRKLEAPLASSFLHHRTASYIQMDQDQTRIQASSPKGGDYGVVLYPLRNGKDKEPVVRELPSGVVEVRWNENRRHLIFCFPDAIEVSEGGFQLKGRAAIGKLEGNDKKWIPLE